MRATTPGVATASWLNRNVAGMSITSFFSDAGHEMVTAVLPGFLGTIGVTAGALGWIEGVSDASSSFAKLGAGWYSDRIGRRKGLVTLGYFVTGTALSLFALAASWPLILLGRVIAWMGRGVRGPLRDALLAESVSPEARGKALGLHRAGDTFGAVVGPLTGIALFSVLPAVNPSQPFRTIFVLSLIPGLAAAGCFALLVRETAGRHTAALRFWHALRGLPGNYKLFLRGVGLFGMGDFAPALLILAATGLLTPAHGAVHAAQIAGALYVLRNVLYAGASFPIGALADRMNKRTLLAGGYWIGALTAFGTAGLFVLPSPGYFALGLVFALSGIYIAAEDALEGAIPADLVAAELRGTAYGLLGTVNGVGDLVASALVGSLWTAVSPVAAFGAAGALMAGGAVLVAKTRE